MSTAPAVATVDYARDGRRWLAHLVPVDPSAPDGLAARALCGVGRRSPRWAQVGVYVLCRRRSCKSCRASARRHIHRLPELPLFAGLETSAEGRA